MAVGVFDMFRVGIGPSSSHTVGPMRAANAFLAILKKKSLFERVARIRIELMGSLAATGHGHGTDTACQLGLMGEAPETFDPDALGETIHRIAAEKRLLLGGVKSIAFDPAADIQFHAQKVPAFHTNALTFTALDESKAVFYERRFYSVGGGFVVAAREDDPERPVTPASLQTEVTRPYPFKTGSDLLAMAGAARKSIAELMMANECALHTKEEVEAKLDEIWSVMSQGIERGLRQEAPLPGPFAVARRAKRLAEDLKRREGLGDPLIVLDWVNAYAIAVSEENAAGGRVVTAPTNGAAGVIPAVIQYYLKHTPNPTKQGVRDFLLTAGAIGILYKENASISGAEVGCQGEVGVACSMAAAGLAAVLGADIHQIENAAEIGMEHNLGLTCDPVAGQVQIPCIERNAIAAVKAINAARMALNGDGSHYVSVDKVIRTMLETGRDMQSKYKETSQGGLAVNIVEC